MTKFLQTAVKLKVIPRSGWISHGVSIHDTESVADHSFSVALTAMVLARLQRKSEVNIQRVLEMALLHDLAETLTFDISKNYLEYLGSGGHRIKRQLETRAFYKIADRMKDSNMISHLTSLFREYQNERTLEARTVQAADRLDTLLQTSELVQRGYPASLLRPLWTQEMRRLVKLRIVPATRIAADLRRSLKKLSSA